MKAFISLITLCIALLYANEINAQVVSGTVSDENGEPLIGANVFEPKTQRGDATNASGFFAINLGQGTQELIISYIGYESDTIRLNLRRDTSLSIRLNTQQIETVIVSASRENNVANTTQLGEVRLSIPQIKRLPSLAGEVDIIKALSFTPGVSNGNEGSSGLFVRGGSPDQNLILLDGAVVYNPNHLFGFLSVFNADAIKDVTLVKGNYPARYGGRLSSVLDIRMREGNVEKWKGEAGVGLLASRLTLEGPLLKNKVSLLVSGRSSYLGLLLFPMRASYKAGRSDSHLSYLMADFNAKLNFRISNTEYISVSTYIGNDHLKLFAQTYPVEESVSKIGWGNSTTTLRHNKAWASGAFLENTLGYTRFMYDFEQAGKQQLDSSSSLFGIGYSSGLEDYFASSRLTFLLGRNHKVQFGIEAVRHHFMPQSGLFTYEDSDGSTRLGVKDERWGTALSAYAEDEWTITKKVSATIGLRRSNFWIDQAYYGAWEPRAGLRYNLRRHTAFKLGFGQTQQYIHLLASSSLGLQNDIWAPATAAAPPQRAKQWAAGLAQYFEQWDTDFSIEYFYKKMDNLTDFGEGVNLQFSVTEQWENLIENQGEGYSTGLEVFLHKKTGRLNGMAAYTYSRSFRRFQNINNGNYFPFKYDAPHQLTTALNWQINQKWDASLSWILRSGYPVSIPDAIISSPPGGETLYSQNVPLFIYNDRGNYRLPAYHRADVAFNHTKTNRWGNKQVWSFGLYNLYNRQNVLYAHLVTQNTGRDSKGNIGIKPTLQTRTLLPILPSVSYSVKF
ncbi:TonB-dependent receptor [Phaeodactylibacter luteus]|nr:TonB-dependent receptor [Phaeodactylibacter luteus]